MPHIIHSAQNEQLKRLAKLLRASKYRREMRQAVLEGVHLLDAFLRAKRLPERVFIPQSRWENTEIQALITRIPEHCLVVVQDNLLCKISALTQADDIITLFRLPEESPPPTDGDCVVLDRVQDPGNVGTVLRSAAAAGIGAVILGEGCADAYAPKVLRAGMGAHFLLDIYEYVSLENWCAHYQSPIFATALRPPVCDVYDLDLRDSCAWLFGNEGSGVAPSLLQKAHTSVRIPMLGGMESLNIAMAATVCVFEQMRQRLSTKM